MLKDVTAGEYVGTRNELRRLWLDKLEEVPTSFTGPKLSKNYHNHHNNRKFHLLVNVRLAGLARTFLAFFY
jgi:hypothetical protein